MVYIMCKAVGKFKYQAKKAKLKIAKKRLKAFTQRHIKKWLEKRKIICKERIWYFLQFQVKYENYVEIKFHQYHSAVLKIQKNIKRFLIRRFIIYAIMNHQWSKIELHLTHKKEITLPKNTSPGQIIPVEIRKFYVRKYLKWKNNQFRERLRIHENRCEEIKYEHRVKLAKKNAFRILNDMEVLRTEAVLPKPPVDYVFVPMSKLKEMVLEAYSHQDAFGDVLKRKRSTKILDTLHC